MLFLFVYVYNIYVCFLLKTDKNAPNKNDPVPFTNKFILYSFLLKVNSNYAGLYKTYLSQNVSRKCENKSKNVEYIL